MERDDFNGVYGKGTENFNSHAHVERDLRQVLLELSLTISTHTLTWSVTRQEMKKLYMNLHFNSHAHVERDSVLSLDKRTPQISTHTLTWSVTNGQAPSYRDYWHFNSHAHVERDT